MANYYIPSLIYGANIKPQKVQKLCSQIAIFPTLFGMLNWNYESNFYGQNVLDANFEPHAFLGTYLKLGDKNAIDFLKCNGFGRFNPLF